MRNSFLYPIPELEEAADLLAQAADSLLAGDMDDAKSCIQKSDMPVIRCYYYLVAGPTKAAIHWQSKGPSDLLPKNQRLETRMPSAKEQDSIFKGDGWRCRFCGIRVISRKARDVLIERLEIPWGTKNKERYSSLLALAVSLDHIVPHSRGGTNARDNLVTACGPCQFGRREWTLDEVGFNHPSGRDPVRDEWDGLTRLIGYK